MRWTLFPLIGLLGGAVTAMAQGTFLYTWHGNFSYFQASFQVPADENQPGQYFDDGTFKSTFTVVSPDNSYPASGGYFSGDDASGFGPPLALSVMMTDPASGKGVDVFGGGVGYYLISEYRLSDNHQLWAESGSWTSTPVPEPSILSLAGVAALAWFARRRFLHQPAVPLGRCLMLNRGVSIKRSVMNVRPLLLLGLLCMTTATMHSQTVDTFNPGADSNVLAMAVQVDGKILVGGDFATLGGQPRNRIGRLNADGTVDASFDPGADGRVVALVVQEDGKILVGGYFGTLGGVPRNRLGRLNSDGTIESSFNPGAEGYSVLGLAVQADGKILALGGFSTLGGQARHYLGRLNSNGSLDTAFAPEPNDYVDGLCIQTDGRIVVGGYFTTLAGKPCSHVGRLYADGSLDTNFLATADNAVGVLAVQADGKLVAGGSFYWLSGYLNSTFGRLNADGTLDAGNPGVAPPVSSLAIQASGNILAAVGSGSSTRVSRLTGLVALDSTFSLPTGGQVYCVVVQPDGRLLVGGNFQTIGAQSRSRIARVASDSAATQSLTYDGANITWLRYGANPMVWRTRFDCSTNGADWIDVGAGVHIPNGWQVTNVALAATATIRARGFVTGSGNGSGWFVESTLGAPVISIQPGSQTNDACSTSTFSVQATGIQPLAYQWCRSGQPLSDGVSVSGTRTSALALANVLGRDAGGYSVIITNTCGSVTSVVATLSVMDPCITQQPLSQTAYSGQMVVLAASGAGTGPLNYQWRKDGITIAGATTTTLTLHNVQPAHSGGYDVVVSNTLGSATSIAAVLSVSSSSMGWTNASAGYFVYAFAVQPDGKIVVGGNLAALCGQTRYGIGRLNADGSLDAGFNPGTSSMSVKSLGIQPDGKILAGGWLGRLAGHWCNALARLNQDGNFDSSFLLADSASGDAVFALAIQPDGKLVIGGNFDWLDGFDPCAFARLNMDGTMDHTLSAWGGGVVFSLAMQDNGMILAGDIHLPDGNIFRAFNNGYWDTSFAGSADNAVWAMLQQPDGKLLLGGDFTNLDSQACSHIGRINPDGTLDTSFVSEANGAIRAMALQADGGILVGGEFTMLGGQARTNLGRLLPDGSLDTAFSPAPAGRVWGALTLLADGSVLVGDDGIRRLNNTESATQTLSYSGSTITWLRGGSAPEVWRTTFDYSTNSAEWISLGAGTRIPGGWRLGGVSVPANSMLRARGFVTTTGNSTWFVEDWFPSGRPEILASDGAFGVRSNRFQFNIRASLGESVIVQASTDLKSWTSIWTNVMGIGSVAFNDPAEATLPYRFYRIALAR